MHSRGCSAGLPVFICEGRQEEKKKKKKRKIFYPPTPPLQNLQHFDLSDSGGLTVLRDGGLLHLGGGQGEPADQRGDREAAAQGQEGLPQRAEAAALRWASPLPKLAPSRALQALFHPSVSEFCRRETRACPHHRLLCPFNKEPAELPKGSHYICGLKTFSLFIHVYIYIYIFYPWCHLQHSKS